MWGKKSDDTCAVDAVSAPHNLLKNLSADVPHVFSDLEPSGLDHEQILIHCGHKGQRHKV